MFVGLSGLDDFMYLWFPFACKTNYEIGGRREGKRDEGRMRRGLVVGGGQGRRRRKGATEDEDKRGAWLLNVRIFFLFCFRGFLCVAVAVLELTL